MGGSMEDGAPGAWEVLVNNRACENKQTCIDVCPTDVFDMLPATVRHPLFWLKIKAHGGQQAVPVREESCIGCMECVTACPELAITVTRRAAP